MTHGGKLIGVGGEASVYDVGTGRALKVFKDGNHADVSFDPLLAEAAEARIAEHQRKLPAMLKRSWPSEVVAPIELYREGSRIVGYFMPLVPGGEPLAALTDQRFRAGMAEVHVLRLLRALHAAIVHTHRAGVVIGDLNPYNVLISGDRVRLIDADSQQFDGFACRLFSDRYTDPRLLDRHGGVLTLNGAYDTEADWYTFAALVLECLAFVAPFGGVHKELTLSERIVNRVTVFDSHVTYPRAARPLVSLPAALRDYLYAVFVDGARGAFPAELLEQLSPPSPHAPARVATGLDVERLLLAPGPLIDVAIAANNRVFALYRDGDTVRREDGRQLAVAGGQRAFFGSARVCAEETIIHHDHVADIDGTLLPADAIATYRRTLVWSHNGALFARTPLGPRRLGQTLASAAIWLGPSFGLGFYRAGDKPVAFLFSPEHRALNDSLVLPRLPAMLSVCAVLSETMAVLTFVVRDRGRITHKTVCFDQRGMRLAEADVDVRGAVAVGQVLLVPSDEGVIRFEPKGGDLQATAKFPATKELVTAQSRLHVGHGGLIVQNAREVLLVRLTGGSS